MLDAKGLEAAKAVFNKTYVEKDGPLKAAISAYVEAVGPEPAVAVKPLEWGEYHALGQSTKLIAHDAFGNEFARLDNPISKSTDEIAAFKAERQTAYEKTIRSALVATPPAAMTCDEQFALATKLAGDLGYDLVPEPPHPDTPVDNFSGQTIPPAETVVEEQVKHMVQRFLQWELPKDFRPDGGISFDPIGNKGTKAEFERNPHGTNLLNHTQATAMVRQIMSGIPGLVAEPATKTLPYDLFTHRDAWRKALEAARDTAEISSPDIDDRSYWQHELDVFDRVFAALAANGGRHE